MPTICRSIVIWNFQLQKKLEEKEIYKDKMIENLQKLEKLINSELTSKIINSTVENEELTIEVSENDLVEIILFLKSNEKCKFRQLIDIAGVDYPEDEKRFQLIYLLLSHENNNRIKLLTKLQT